MKVDDLGMPGFLILQGVELSSLQFFFFSFSQSLQ